MVTPKAISSSLFLPIPHQRLRVIFRHNNGGAINGCTLSIQFLNKPDLSSEKNISWEPLRSIRVETWRILVSFTIFGVAPPQYNKDSPIWIYWREYRVVVRGVAHMAHNWPLPFISQPLRPTRLTQRMFSHPQDIRYWPGGQLLHTLPTTLQRVAL